jgi:lipoprotein-releasing system permease protein
MLAFDEGKPRFAFRTLAVRGTFASGFSEFDRGWLVVGKPALAGAPGGAPGVWEIRLTDRDAAAEAAESIRGRLGSGFLVLDWQQLNRELFAALELQKRALFLLLGLIVLVATFNVASTLVVLVRERRRDFGVLAAIGLAPARLERTFLLVGALLGAVGRWLALAFIAEVATLRAAELGPEMAEVYFLRSVPLRLAWRRQAVAGLAIADASPAAGAAAARTEPAEAL